MEGVISLGPPTGGDQEVVNTSLFYESRIKLRGLNFPTEAVISVINSVFLRPSLLKKAINLWPSVSLPSSSATQDTGSLVLFLTSAMQIYTVRLPTSTATHVDKIRWQQHSEPIVSPVRHPRAELEAVLRFRDSGLPAAPSVTHSTTAQKIDEGLSELIRPPVSYERVLLAARVRVYETNLKR